MFINHCKTNHHLAVQRDFTLKTPFGREHEVTACTKYNTHKAEDEHNHFIISTVDPQDIVAALPA